MRLRLLVAVVAIAAGLVVDPVAAHAAPTVNASVATFVRGEVRGIVYSRPLGDAGADVRLALAQLTPGTTYVVKATTRPCGQPVQVGDDEVWAVDVDVPAGGFVFAHRRTERFDNPFSAIRSVRVAGVTAGGLEVDRACVPGVRGHVAPPPVEPPANTSLATWVRGPFRGVAYARASGEVLADVRFSLTGMEPETTYLLTGSTRPCSRPARDSQSVWVIDIASGPEGERHFRRRLTERFGTFAQIRSTRLYVLEDPGQFGVQVSCVPGAVGRLRPPA
ncbi:MAG TPA: hypothetical protein VD926_06470 [Acidimicrobiales bacterium]|nr:hypothetical protein [Acidimicrobiales bacterium]